MNNKFQLKHSLQPYIGIGVLLLLIFIGTNILSFYNHNTNLESILIIPVLAIIFYIPWIYINLKYKIIYINGVIEQQASWAAPKNINVQDISSLKIELSLLSLFKRPLRSIVIYSNDGTSIDVSLKHFVRKDIQKLLSLISESRLDLEIPKF